MVARPSVSRVAIWAGIAIAAMSSVRADNVSDLMAQAKYGEAQQQLATELAQRPDDLARMQLGVVQVLAAIQGLVDDHRRYGAQAPSLPLLSFQGANFRSSSKPEPMTYADARAMIERFRVGLVEAEATLAEFQNPIIKWRVPLQQVAFDLNGDGTISANENLVRLTRMGELTPLERAERRFEPNTPDPPRREFVVAMDEADVAWLRGYCHATAGTCDILLAHDFQEFFELTGHLVFRGAQTRYDFLKPYDEGVGWEPLRDIIAAIHLARFNVVEPERMRSAHDHFQQTIRMSRQMWKLAQAETDDDHEWIANPKQKRALPLRGIALTEQQWNEWPAVLDESEAILQGRKLLPLWRTPEPDRGVNLKQVFYEPREFDLVLWAQQSAAMPFVEQGPVTDPATWRRMNDVFGGNLTGYAFWLN